MAKRTNRRIGAILGLTIGCLSAAPSAFACAFHAIPDAQLTGMYPGSLSVAVALRKAADSGVIDATALEAPGKRGAVYIDSVRRLHALRKAIAASPAVTDLPASFSLGYVESQLWTRYSQSGGEIRADVHTDGPADGEAVVLTGEPVIVELLAGRLSIERAIASGMVLIQANDINTAAIRHVLHATSMANNISSL